MVTAKALSEEALTQLILPKKEKFRDWRAACFVWNVKPKEAKLSWSELSKLMNGSGVYASPFGINTTKAANRDHTLRDQKAEKLLELVAKKLSEKKEKKKAEKEKKEGKKEGKKEKEKDKKREETKQETKEETKGETKQLTMDELKNFTIWKELVLARVYDRAFFFEERLQRMNETLADLKRDLERKAN